MSPTEHRHSQRAVSRAWRSVAVVVVALASIGIPAAAQDADDSQMALAARVDPYVERPRVLVLTDIANEPDDQMSLVRFLVYSNELEVEGLVATTSTWLKEKPRPDVIHEVIDAYEEVQPNLLLHADGFPTADRLHGLVATGQPSYGMAAVGPDKMSAGAERLLAAAAEPDERPLWVTIWGGANTLAQALLHARETMTTAELDALVSKLRVYSISDQDDAGPWIRREFPRLHYVARPSTPNGEEYRSATWTGISGDSYYKNAPGGDLSTFTDEWLDENIRSKGPLGEHYPYPCCIHEGDTPSFLGLINNGLASYMSPTYGGWGGRYVWRQPYGESRPSWTQGGDSFPIRPSSRDTVVGVDGRTYTSDQATIWRWRRAFQHDFAARMAWTVQPPEEANHNPRLVLNGVAGRAPVSLAARVGEPLELDAKGSADPDGNALTYRWLFYPEAGTGIPGRPVFTNPRALFGPRQPGPASGPPALISRIDLKDAETPVATVIPRVPGVAHVILVVEDDGSPSLTSYRRVLLEIQPAPPPPS